MLHRAGDKVSKYSMGMRQRLGVAACLLEDPQLLILDEPMNGLDPAGILEMREMIQSLAAEGRTVFLSSHLLDEVERTCDAVAIVDKGKVIRQGSIDELLAGASVEIEIDCSSPDRAKVAPREHAVRCPRGSARRGLGDRALPPGRIGGRRRRSIVSSSRAGSPSIGSKRSTPRSRRGSSRSQTDWGPTSDDVLGFRCRDRLSTGRGHLAHPRPPGLVDPNVGHGHHALDGAAQATGADDRPGRRQHRHPGTHPRRAAHRPRRGPQVLRTSRWLQHLHRSGAGLDVRLRLHRGCRRRLHGRVGRPQRRHVPPPGDHRPFPLGPLPGQNPRRAGHRHLHGGHRLHDRLRGVRVRRPDAVQLRRDQRVPGAVASRSGHLGRRTCRRGHLQLQLQRAERPTKRALRQRSDQRSPAGCHRRDAARRGHCARLHAGADQSVRRHHGQSGLRGRTAPPSWPHQPR